MIIAYNIGYSIKGVSGGVFGYAEIFTCKNIRQFTDDFRQQSLIKILMDFADEQNVPRSSIVVLMNIDNRHKFLIRMKNTKEYKKVLDKFLKEKKDRNGI